MSTLIHTRPVSTHRAEPKGILATLLAFQARWRQRKHLAEMDAHQRKDLGLSQADIHSELRRPIWNAPRNWRR